MDSMKPAFDQLIEFHRAFDIPFRQSPTANISQAEYELRHELIREETEEYLEACQQGDLVEIADALGDQLYVLCGTIIAHGLQDKIMEVFTEIHRSNMSKLDSSGKALRRADGKVIKSDRFFRPDLTSILFPSPPQNEKS